MFSVVINIFVDLISLYFIMEIENPCKLFHICILKNTKFGPKVLC